MGFLMGAGQAITPQNTYSPAAGTIGDQQQLAAALQAQSQGQGPNPVQQQFQQNTNQQISQQAGAIGSQKGISPALAQKLASESGSQMMNNQAGQAATLQAQQQLGAQQQQAGVYGQIGNEQLGLSGQNAQIAGQNAAANQNATSGIMQGLGTAAMIAMMSKGGQVQKFDSGGGVNGYQQLQAPGNGNLAQAILNSAGAGPMAAGGGGPNGLGSTLSAVAKTGIQNSQDNSALDSMVGEFDSEDTAAAAGVGGGGGAGVSQMLMAKGGMMPEHLHHVARIYHPNFQAKNTEQLKATGGPVPGKAKVKGDSPKNDTVKTMLSPGEVVIPRSIMQSEDPVKNAAAFVADQLRKNGKQKEDGSPEEFKTALKKAIGSRKAA